MRSPSPLRRLAKPLSPAPARRAAVAVSTAAPGISRLPAMTSTRPRLRSDGASFVYTVESRGYRMTVTPRSRDALTAMLQRAAASGRFDVIVLARGGGSLIFTSTFVGHTLGLPGMAAYAASKAGLIGLTQVLAAEQRGVESFLGAPLSFAYEAERQHNRRVAENGLAELAALLRRDGVL